MSLKSEIELLIEELRNRPMTAIRSNMSVSELVAAARDNERILISMELSTILAREKTNQD